MGKIRKYGSKIGFKAIFIIYLRKDIFPLNSPVWKCVLKKLYSNVKYFRNFTLKIWSAHQQKDAIDLFWKYKAALGLYYPLYFQLRNHLWFGFEF